MNILIVAVFAGGACERQQPNYCDKAIYHNCLEIDASIPDVSSDRPLDCTPSICSGTKPVCGIHNMCEPCTAHAQCETSVCLPDGSCAPEQSISYVNEGGTSKSCTKDAPCGTLNDGVEKQLPYVKVIGTIEDTDVVTLDDQAVTIFADIGTKLISRNTAVKIRNYANVTIYDMEITTTEVNTDGIQIESTITNVGSPVLNLVRVTIDDCKGNGINATGGSPVLDLFGVAIHAAGKNGIKITGGSLAIMQSSISDNLDAGIDVGDSAVSIVQSSVYDNHKDGILAMDTDLSVAQTSINNNKDIGIKTTNGNVFVTRSSIFENQNGGLATDMSNSLIVRNTFIYRNTKTTSVVLSLAPSGTGEFRFNTIADNSTSSNVPAGVSCNGSFPIFSDNIIFRNKGSTSSQNGSCVSNGSYIGDGSVDLGFVQSETRPYDYHLTAMSPTGMAGMAGVVGAESMKCDLNVDFDGDARSNPCDFGADELRP